MDWDKRVGRNLRRLRKERGLTQESVALDAEITPRYLGMAERGEKSLTVRVLARIAQSLEVSPAALFDASDECA